MRRLGLHETWLLSPKRGCGADALLLPVVLSGNGASVSIIYQPGGICTFTQELSSQHSQPGELRSPVGNSGKGQIESKPSSYA